jgi:hypothetical protein
MNIMYNIMLIYGLTFVIGFFVSGIIWLLYTTMTAKDSIKITHRESYSELKRLKQKYIKSAK